MSTRQPSDAPAGASDVPRPRHVSPSAVRARADETRRRLEERRKTNPFVDAALGAFQLHSESGGVLLAGAIAFRFFLFLVPCVFVIVMGLGLGADLAHADVQDVARKAGIAGVAAAAIRSGAEATTTTQWVTFGLAVVALVSGARNLLSALWIAHALLWQVPRQKLRHPGLAGLTLIGATVALTLFVRALGALRGLTFVGWVVGIVLFTLLPAVAWLLCSAKVFPHPVGVTWQQFVPGSALFGLGMQGLHLVTVLYVAPSTAAKSQTYGAIGAALTILVWAYLLGRLVTLSIALNATLWRRSVTARRA